VVHVTIAFTDVDPSIKLTSQQLGELAKMIDLQRAAAVTTNGTSRSLGNLLAHVQAAQSR
jgi:hypothetical protein